MSELFEMYKDGKKIIYKERNKFFYLHEIIDNYENENEKIVTSFDAETYPIDDESIDLYEEYTKTIITYDKITKKYFFRIKFLKDPKSLLRFKQNSTHAIQQLQSKNEITWYIREYKINSIFLETKYIGESSNSNHNASETEVMIHDKKHIFIYLVRKVLTINDDELLLKLYENFKKMYSEDVLPSTTKETFNDTQYVLLSYGTFIESNSHMLTKDGYDTKIIETETNLKSKHYSIYKGQVKNQNRNGNGCLYLCPKKIKKQDADFNISDPGIKLDPIKLIYDGEWKDDKIYTGTFFISSDFVSFITGHNETTTDKQNIIAEIIIKEGNIVSYNNYVSENVSILNYSKILDYYGVDTYSYITRKDKLKKQIFNNRYLNQSQEELKQDPLYKDVVNKSTFDTDYVIYKNKMDNKYKRDIQNGKTIKPRNQFQRNIIQQIKAELQAKEQNKKIIIEKDFPIIYKHDSNTKFQNIPNDIEQKELEGNYTNFDFKEEYQKFFNKKKLQEKRINQINIEKDLQKLYNQSEQDFEPSTDIPKDLIQGHYNNLDEFNRRHAQHFYKKKMEDKKRNEIIENILKELFKLKKSLPNKVTLLKLKKELIAIANPKDPYYMLEEKRPSQKLAKTTISGIKKGDIFQIQNLNDNFFVQRTFEELYTKNDFDYIYIVLLSPIERFKRNIHGDREIATLYKQLEEHEIPLTQNIMELIDEKYEKEELNSLITSYTDLVEKKKSAIDTAIEQYNRMYDQDRRLSMDDQNLQISDQQANIVQRMNKIIKKLDLQQSQELLQEKKKRVMAIKKGATAKIRNNDGRNILDLILDDNFRRTYPKLYDNMNKNRITNPQNPQQTTISPQQTTINPQDRVELLRKDVNLIKSGKPITMNRHQDLKEKLLTISSKKIWKDNFEDDNEILNKLIYLQKRTIIKDIFDNIKFRLDYNYYKKVQFIQKYEDRITDCILNIDIPQEYRLLEENIEDKIEYVYFIIDYANIKYAIESHNDTTNKEFIEKKVNEYIKEQIDSTIKNYSTAAKPYSIVVKQGKNFTTSLENDKITITAPCKIGSGSKKNDAFLLHKDHDINIQYLSRMKFHKNIDADKIIIDDNNLKQDRNKTIMTEFENDYDSYNKQITQIQDKITALKSDSSDQNKVTSSNVQKSISDLKQQKKNRRKHWLKKIRANPNDDLMCIIIMLFFRQYFYITNLNLPVRILSKDRFEDYRMGHIDSMQMKKNFL